MHQILKLLRIQINHLICGHNLYRSHQIGWFILCIGNALFNIVGRKTYLIQILFSLYCRIIR